MTTDTPVKQNHFLRLSPGCRGQDGAFCRLSYACAIQAGIKQEHLHSRDNAGLFDVSHMGQVIVKGEGAALALEKLMPVDLEVSGDQSADLRNPDQ